MVMCVSHDSPGTPDIHREFKVAPINALGPEQASLARMTMLLDFPVTPHLPETLSNPTPAQAPLPNTDHIEVISPGDLKHRCAERVTILAMTARGVRRKIQSPWLEMGLAALGALFITLPVLGPLVSNLRAPWGSGDLIAHYVSATTWAPFGTPTTTHFGFPDGLDHRYFPTIDVTQNAFAWLLYVATGSPFIGLNLLLLLSFPIIAGLTALALHLVGARGPLVAVLAIALTTIPYHFDRGVSHVYLAVFYSVVTGVALSVIIGTDRVPNSWRPSRFMLLIVGLTIVTAWSGVYYAVFGLTLIIAAVLWRWIEGDSIKRLGQLMIIPLSVALLAVLAFLPAAIRNLTDPPLNNLIQRDPGESVIFSGNLAQTLVPFNSEFIPGIGKLTTALKQAMVANASPGENAIGGYGTLVTTSALLVFLLGWAVLVRRKSLTTPLPLIGFLTLVSVWFMIPWGGGFLFASLITPQIRAWGRITPVILLLVILGAGAVIAKTRFGQATAWRMPVAWIISGVMVITVFSTQVLPFRDTYADVGDTGRDVLTELTRYSSAVNAAIPLSCGILQLPYMVFPENGIRKPELNDYEHALHPLTNPDKDFSYGAVKGTRAAVLTASLSDPPTMNQINQLTAQGFCGLHLDRRGYTKRSWKRLNNELRAIYGEPAAEGQFGNWAMYRIQ